MPVMAVNGINLSYQVHGCGEPVLLITGSAGGGGCGSRIRFRL